MDAVFGRAISIELQVADIFSRIGRLFSHVPELSGFWQELSEDEVRHATSLTAVRDMVDPAKLLTQCDHELWDNVAQVQRMLDRDLVGPINLLNDAYELAHDLEFSEVNAIFKLLAAEFVPSDARTQFVTSEIAQHQAKLSDFSENFGDRNWRMGIDAQRA